MSTSTAISQRRRKRMRTQTRSTAWKDSYELDRVGQSLLLAVRLLSPQGEMTTTLLSETERADLAHALCRVNMWKARSDQGRIPHSMETTFALAQVAWRDATNIDGSVSTMELRMTYATAILRGVNGLADTLQQHRAYAASVASLCEQLGLPGWLVDIRHEAAHNDLPSLSVLRLACKTFLGYLEERYWIPLANARSEARETAVQLLVKYKETCKKRSSTGDGDESEKKEAAVEEMSSNESTNSDESEAEDGDNMCGQSLGTNQNRFAVFLDSAEPAKKKQKKEPPKNEEEKNAQNAVHSALHFVRVFIRDTPIDVGYNVALTFLVWGGIRDAPPGRGVLIPGSPTSFPASEEGIHRIRQRYNPLLLVFCKAWPGFTHALLVHLVDHVLSIESSVETELDAGSERKLYFLSSWVRFLLSREFHMHNDVSVALYRKQDLSKKSPLTWTKAEREFLESPAPYSVLAQAGLPLNSLCDRCIETSKADLPSGSHALSAILNDILGDQRASNHGIPIAEFPQEAEQLEATSATKPATLSLDEMEMMLNEDTNEVTGEESKPNMNSTQDETAVLSTNAKNRWTQCSDWDPCAIGSLPGTT